MNIPREKDPGEYIQFGTLNKAHFTKEKNHEEGE